MELSYQSESNNTQDALYYAQIIANAFSKTLEDNNCLLILTVGLHQQINEAIQDVKTIAETISDTNNNLVREDTLTPEIILSSLQSAIKSSKDKCFNCDIKLPKLSFNNSLDSALDNLRNLLKLFSDTFKLNKLDLCQASYALDKACLPDILKLITLLLTAYVAIMGLKKLSNISIGAFIKGILSSIMGQLLGSVNISVNISGSTVGCLIEALRDIAAAIPTENNIRNGLDDDTNAALGSNLLSNVMTNSLDNAINNTSKSLSSVGNRINNVEKNLNESFKFISDVVDESVKDVGEYIQSLLNFKTHFECETKRSGMDVMESLAQVNKLISVINLLSSVALSLAKKEVRDKICKTPMNINTLSTTTLDDLRLKDLIEDYNQKQVEIISSSPEDLEVLISDRPKEDALPKIDLLNCSIDDFIQAHTIGNVLNTATLQVERELNNPTTFSKYEIADATYRFVRPSLDTITYIDDIINLIYTDPNITENNVTDSDIKLTSIDLNDFGNINNPIDRATDTIIKETIKPSEITNSVGKDGISSLLEDLKTNKQTSSNLSCKSIDEVLNILQQIRR